MKKAIIDIPTGKTSVFDLIGEELENYENYKMNADKQRDELLQSEEQAKAEKAAILDRLGITEAEAKLLLS